MKNYIKILLFAICILTTSCNFLDRDPDFTTPENYYKTEAEMTNALNGVYNRLIDTNGRMYSRGLYSYFAISDESYYKNISMNNIKVMTMDAAQLDIGRFWEALYEGINRTNLLLKNMENSELKSRNVDAIKGEALFMRGYYYFILTTFFGEVPLKLTPTEAPSDKYLAKSPLVDIYAQIIKDMQEAEGLVYGIEELKYNERISKTGVQAILARVFLKMAGNPLKDESRYEDALTYTNLVIGSGKHQLNSSYQGIFINHSQDRNEPKECIWEVGMYGNKIGDIDQAGAVGIENGILCPSEAMGYSGGGIQITEKLYQAFSNGDTRRNWNIAPYRFVTNPDTKEVYRLAYAPTEIYQRNPGKWRREHEVGEKARSYNSTNFPVIRYSDVLLMKAEAENAVNGANPAAYDAINKVRRRAYGLPVETPDPVCDVPAGLGKVEFQLEIQDERYRELCFEGVRKLDLIRWGIYVETMNALGRSITATAPTAYRYAASAGNNTTERHVVFPIPNTEIMVNKLMTQNEGW